MFEPVRWRHHAGSAVTAWLWTGLLALATVRPALAADGQSPLKVVGHEGRESFTAGVLMQPTFTLDAAARETQLADACFRRIRLVTSTQLGRLSVFADTDTPFLGYHETSRWSAPATVLQDLIITYRVSAAVSVDTGLLLVPVSYNSTQSAASLLAIGYGPYSFLASAPTHSKAGRDEGMQVRGAVLKRRLEFRAGLFRGVRHFNPNAAPRVAARLAWSLAGSASPAFFYQGTQMGKQKKAIVGVSADTQEQYHAVATDAYLEWPTVRRQHVTVQADVIHYDGGRTLRQLPAQVAWMIEGGYLFSAWRLQPFVQLARQDVRNPASADAASYQCGLIYWRRGHAMNVKVGVGRTTRERTSPHVQFTAQSQVFIF